MSTASATTASLRQSPSRTIPAPPRLLQIVTAVAIVVGPLGYLVGGLLSPSINASSADSIAASTSANSTWDHVHLWAFAISSYALPISALGLAWLCYRATPWLAVLGGLLGLIGWAPFSALTALDELTNVMAHPSSDGFADLRDRFSFSGVMLSFLVVYIVAHLVAYVMFGVGLRKNRAIPAWAASSIVASSPFTILAFALPGSPRLTGGIALALLVAGSIPAARRMVAAPTAQPEAPAR
jgi:hypothetical protein